MDYSKKYLKYKQKYTNLKRMFLVGWDNCGRYRNNNIIECEITGISTNNNLNQLTVSFNNKINRKQNAVAQYTVELNKDNTIKSDNIVILDNSEKYNTSALISLAYDYLIKNKQISP